MLLTKEVKMRWNPSNKNRLVNLGYVFTKIGDYIVVNIDHVEKQSHIEVEVKCDYCGVVNLRKYQNYNLHHDEHLGDCCKRCMKIKTTKTSKIKYGTDFPIQNDIVKRKQAETNIEKYGNKSSFQNEEVRQKYKDTLISKYGVDNISKCKDIVEKRKNTMIEKYGDDYNKVIYEKSKKAVFDKYGVNNIFELEEIQFKIRQSYNNNGTCKTSKVQLDLYNTISDYYKNDTCILNYPLDYYILDIMLIIDNIKIDIEFDGQHWHDNEQSKMKDNKRNGYCYKNNIKVLRIKGNNKIPTIDEITKAVNNLINSKNKYIEIYTDWKNN